MKSRALILIGLFVAGLVTVGGCSNHDSNEWERLVCEVESINGGVPLISAYLDVGADVSDPDDDTLPVDWVPVVFRARPYNSAIVLPEDDAQSWFHVTNYDLTWVPGPNAPAELTNFNITNGLCEAIVPVNEQGAVSVLIADRVMKEEPWFVALYTSGTASFTAACQLTFKGHESGNSRVVSIESGFMVTFLGAVAED